MSPEQARGKPIDKRTDLWAFGCCLYETLTGRKVFSEETVTDTISAVVRAEPDWSKVSDIPARIQTLLHRCLRKNAEKRLRDIGDARLELEDALDEPIPESVAAPSGAPAAGRWMLAVGLLLAALSVTLFFARRDAIPERRPVRRFTSVELLREEKPGPTLAVSRDGAMMVRVAFGTGQETGDDAALYVRRLDEAEARRLDGTEPITLAESDAPSMIGFGRPSFLPGGEALLVTTRSESGDESVGVFSLASGTTELLIGDGRSPKILPTGHVVFARSGVLFAAKLDPNDLSVFQCSGARDRQNDSRWRGL